MEGMGTQLPEGGHCLSRRYMDHMIQFELTIQILLYRFNNVRHSQTGHSSEHKIRR